MPQNYSLGCLHPLIISLLVRKCGAWKIWMCCLIPNSCLTFILSFPLTRPNRFWVLWRNELKNIMSIFMLRLFVRLWNIPPLLPGALLSMSHRLNRVKLSEKFLLSLLCANCEGIALEFFRHMKTKLTCGNDGAGFYG